MLLMLLYFATAAIDFSSFAQGTGDDGEEVALALG